MLRTTMSRFELSIPWLDNDKYLRLMCSSLNNFSATLLENVSRLLLDLQLKTTYGLQQGLRSVLSIWFVFICLSSLDYANLM